MATEEDIDPMDATLEEEFDPYMGRLVTVDARGESYTLMNTAGVITAVVGFHPEWAIEAIERDGRYEVRRVTEEDFYRAQRDMFGIDTPDEGGDP